MLDDLLAAIVAQPDDDAARLVLADALAQRGDSWGEMIVLSCELAPYANGKRRWSSPAREITMRFKELADARFLGEGLTYSFERGFCTEVEVGPKGELARLAGPPFALLDSLVLRHATPERIAELAAWPRLPQLGRLRIERTDHLGNDRLEVVPAIARARSLQALSLLGANITRADLESIFAVPHIAQLRTLKVIANAPLSGALRGVRWPQLEELDLSACTLNDIDVDHLLESERVHQLRALDLIHNLFGAQAGASLANSPFERLEKLTVLGNPLGGGAIARIVANPRVKGLVTLAVGDDDDVLDEALPLIGAELPRLEILHLRSGVRVRGLPAIARPYRELDLRLGGIEPTELAALLAHPAMRALRMLWICTTPFATAEVGTGARIASVIAAAPLPELDRLYLDRCGVGAAGARALAQALHLPRDLELTFFGEDVGDVREELAARFALVDAS